MFFLHNALVPHVDFTYTCNMKNIVVVLGTFLFGVSIVSWVHCFTPSFCYRDETEIVVGDGDVD
jgi:hypothetical protein